MTKAELEVIRAAKVWAKWWDLDREGDDRLDYEILLYDALAKLNAQRQKAKRKR